jgi:hypothetical protein
MIVVAKTAKKKADRSLPKVARELVLHFGDLAPEYKILSALLILQRLQTCYLRLTTP